MVNFLEPSAGGLLPINGALGSIVKDLSTAKRGTPGKDIIISPINQIIAATQISIPSGNCDTLAAMISATSSMQDRIADILDKYISEIVTSTIQENAVIQNLQQQITNIENQQSSNPLTQTDQIEILTTDRDTLIKAVVISAISFVSRAVPEAAKIANAPGGSIKMIAGVTAHLEAPIGTAINLGRYSGAATEVAVEVLSSACSMG